MYSVRPFNASLQLTPAAHKSEPRGDIFVWTVYLTLSQEAVDRCSDAFVGRDRCRQRAFICYSIVWMHMLICRCCDCRRRDWRVLVSALTRAWRPGYCYVLTVWPWPSAMWRSCYVPEGHCCWEVWDLSQSLFHWVNSFNNLDWLKIVHQNSCDRQVLMAWYMYIWFVLFQDAFTLALCRWMLHSVLYGLLYVTRPTYAYVRLAPSCTCTCTSPRACLSYAQAHDSQVRRHLGDSDRIAELDAKYLQLLNYVQKKTVANQRDASDSDEGTCTYNSFSFASFCPQAVYVKPTYMRVLINVQVTNLYM